MVMLPGELEEQKAENAMFRSIVFSLKKRSGYKKIYIKGLEFLFSQTKYTPTWPVIQFDVKYKMVTRPMKNNILI